MKKKFKEVLYDISLFTDYDIHLFKEGSHFKLYNKLVSHLMDINGATGTYFAVWAPSAKSVSVIGDFNEWNPNSHFLKVREDGSGIWEGFISGVEKSSLYKYHIVSKYNNYEVDKGDQFSFYWEISPKTASIVWDLKYKWNDNEWMENRYKVNSLKSPISIYEVHFGSFRRVPDENNRYLPYREMANYLTEYIKYMGFTHGSFYL